MSLYRDSQVPTLIFKLGKVWLWEHFSLAIVRSMSVKLVLRLTGLDLVALLPRHTEIATYFLFGKIQTVTGLNCGSLVS